LLSGSLRSNIDPEQKHTDAHIKDLLKKACLDNLMNREQGLYLDIEEGGANLSQGER
jgi:ABC-type multidrug transport system fused ATPase/permease subunit